MGQVIFTVFLVLAAWQDQRKQKIPAALFGWFGLAGALVFFHSAVSEIPVSEITLSSMVLRMLPGLLCLVLSWGTRGAIGTGDGCFFLIAALYLPWKVVWFLFLGGLLCCGVGSLYVLGKGLVRGVSVRGARLPFLPFLLPVWLWGVLVRGGI